MIDFFLSELPSTIEVEGSLFIINTDFRYFIHFQKVLSEKYKLEDFDFMFPFEKPVNRLAGLEKLIDFFAPKELLPRADGKSENKKVVDYNIDADYIYSAFLEQYGIDLTDMKLKLHWYKFQALFKSLHDTKINEIMGYRCWSKSTSTDNNRIMQKLQNQWDLPQPEDLRAQEDLDNFIKLLNE